MRRFVQAEAEQNLITYLEDNGVSFTPTRGVALQPDDYGTTTTAPSVSEAGR